MKKYQELETKVKELQEEIERLKKEEEKEEKENKLPKGFECMNSLEFLKTYSRFDLQESFLWDDTPQGREYWNNIHWSLKMDPEYVVSDKAIIQIQKWIILHLQSN